MTLCIDIGNSSIKLGIFDGDRLLQCGRIGSGAGTRVHEIVGSATVDRAGICSVVPARTDAISRMVQARWGISPITIDTKLRLPFALAYETPETLGTDRLAAAAGACALFPNEALLVTVDAGSAITLEVVHEGRFLGGAILPGPSILHEALAAHTGQLPRVEAQLVDVAVARSTVGGLRAGVTAATVGGVRYVLEDIEREFGDDGVVVACGGWASELAQHLPQITHVEEHIVLHGIRALLDANSADAAS